jgi:hypothetical protein
LVDYLVTKKGDELEGLSLPLHSIEEEGVVLLYDGDLFLYSHDDVEEDYYVDQGPLPEDAEARKNIPVYSGFFKYFPDAIVAVSHLSLIGGIQHGQTRETLHWDRSKSTDHTDALLRHLLEEDWAAVAWRALAQLQKSIEEERKYDD